ncbi:hypothetical protein [Thorsellia kenyensis]|uniref:Tetratricopeptide repeat protein n=1 Tax=Thorsellia kenyensis TaxID=1549888 RepID=A0ABV6CE66_9GAMM
MSMWQWAEDLNEKLHQEGNHRLANLIYQIPNDYWDGNYKRLDATIEEAILGAKSINNPWLEVYFRHFSLRHKVGSSREGEKAMTEVITLMELAHRDEAKDCPHSVCATQDLVNCYENIDNIGYANDRIVVIDETLSRITKDISCWYCLTLEKVDALCDLNQYEQAYETVTERTEKERENIALSWHSREIRILLHLNRIDEAVVLFEQYKKREGSSDTQSAQYTTQLLEASLLNKQGKYEEAFAILPPFSELEPAKYLSYLSAYYNSIKDLEISNKDWHIAGIADTIINYFKDAGSYAAVFDAAEIQFELALKRRSKFLAQKSLDSIEEVIPKLKEQSLRVNKLNQFKTKFNNTQFTQPKLAVENLNEATDTLDSIGEFLSQLGQPNENNPPIPEKDLATLLAYYELSPLYPGLADGIVAALNAMNFQSYLFEFCRSHIDKYIKNEEISDFIELFLLRIYRQNDLKGLIEYKEKIDTYQPKLSLYLACLIAILQKDWDKLKIKAIEGLDSENFSYDFYHMLDMAYEMQNDLVHQIQTIQNFVERLESDGETEYLYQMAVKLLTLLPIVDDWATYRKVCAKIKIELNEPSSPDNLAVIEPSGTVLIQYLNEEGEHDYYYATRLSPTTAQIYISTEPFSEQRANDIIIFSPKDLGNPPEEEEKQGDYLATYEFLYCLSLGKRRSMYFDGILPTNDEFKALTDNLHKLEINYNQFRYLDEESNIERLRLHLAVAENMSDGDVKDLIAALTKEFAHPFESF